MRKREEEVSAGGQFAAMPGPRFVNIAALYGERLSEKHVGPAPGSRGTVRNGQTAGDEHVFQRAKMGRSLSRVPGTACVAVFIFDLNP